jgi:tyrosine-protein kinase Etk/Wzc
MDTVTSFGQPVNTTRGSFRIFPHPDMEHVYNSNTRIYLKFNSHEALTEGYRNRLKVNPVSDESTIVQLTLEGTNRWKDQMFLDKLLEVFLARNLAKKNHEASRIIDFIDSQLGEVSDSLKITENQLQEFRSRNRIMDVSSQAQQIIDQSVVLENEKARLTLESNYYEYLEEYLSKDNNQEVPISPATMGIEDPILARLMQELGGLQAEYFGTEMREKNPLQAQLELRIRNTKESIRETLQGIMRANRMAIAENDQQIEALNDRASILPEKERQLLGIERKFNLNNVLYTFLLQERAEAQIQKASNRPDNELIDSARAQKNPISPNRKKIFLLAFSLAIVLPLLLLLAMDLVNANINSEEDLKMITSLPIVGHIPHSRLSYNTVVLNESRSRVAEAFRTIRTRMEFMTRDTACPIIVVTSSIPAEGKTFAAINLASAYSLAGKKTLLMGFDLRRPTISASFQLNGQPGLSTYLIGKNQIDQIIYDTGHPNLSFIPSGPIPPNPGELANSARAMELLEGLRNRFDFIVIDSAPIGVVADNFMVASAADAIMMIVRHGKTNRNHLRATLSELQDAGVHSIGLIVNDVKSRGGTYSYSYNYKYGEKYVRATQKA